MSEYVTDKFPDRRGKSPLAILLKAEYMR